MGKTISAIRYFFSSFGAEAHGLGTKLSEVKGIKDIEVFTVSKEGPFDGPKEDTAKVKVVDFWKEKTVVIHLLRRFG